MSYFADQKWPQLDQSEGWIGVLPIGAVEAHGPHLPLATDCWIAEAMASAGVQRLAHHEIQGLVFPVHGYTAAGFAGEFVGTVDVVPSATEEVVVATASAVQRAGGKLLVVVNAHFDPANVGAIRNGVERANGATVCSQTIFFDLTRRKNAERIGGEFATGACHAGRYEGSLMLAIRPDLVDEETAAGLPPYPRSLAEAIQAGASTFQELGGDQAYFGWPAEASREEGEETLGLIGEMMADEVQKTLAARKAEGAE